ncbi:MAG: sensor histidine kinase [Anaerolineales bacterium]
MNTSSVESIDQELEHCRAELERAARVAATLQKQIAEADTRQHELDVLKTNFIALVSHELRTPVAVLSGFLEVGLSEFATSLSPEQQEYFETASRNARRLSRVVQELTDFSRYQAERQVDEISPLSVSQAIEQVLLILQPALDSKQLKPENQLPAQLGDLEFDGETLVIIFRNLLSNAAKFTDPGGRIWITGTLEGDDGIIGIHDTATPIPPEKRDVIFEDFRQLENHLTRRYEGLGLGLALARRAARALGGDLRLKVRGDEGNSFLVTLPMTNAA